MNDLNEKFITVVKLPKQLFLDGSVLTINADKILKSHRSENIVPVNIYNELLIKEKEDKGTSGEKVKPKK